MLTLSNTRVAAGTLFAAVLVSVVCPDTTAAQGPPQIPATYFGTVEISGSPAPDGARVRALVNGKDCTQTGASPAVLDSGVARYVIAVVHESQVPGCAVDGAEVTFTVDGVEVSPRVTWRSGPKEVNLAAAQDGSATAGQTPTPLPPESDQQPAEQESDEGISGAVWFALGGAALLAGAAAGALIFWRKRQGKG